MSQETSKSGVAEVLPVGSSAAWLLQTLQDVRDAGGDLASITITVMASDGTEVPWSGVAVAVSTRMGKALHLVATTPVDEGARRG